MVARTAGDLAVSDWDPDHGPVIFERQVADCSQ